MKTHQIATRVALAAVMTLALAVASPRAFQGAAGGGAQKVPVPTPLKVDVVVSRFQGDKKVGSLPFTLWVTASTRGGVEPTSLRMGVDVPVGTASQTRTSGVNSSNQTERTSSVPEYRYVGTQIDTWAVPTDDGRFTVNLRLTDSSVFTADQDGRAAIKSADVMAFRSFTTSNTLTMRDGQTLQFATATDKITGEIIKVDVTITVAK